MLKVKLNPNIKEQLKQKFYNQRVEILGAIVDHGINIYVLQALMNNENYCCSKKTMQFIRAIFPEYNKTDLFLIEWPC